MAYAGTHRYPTARTIKLDPVDVALVMDSGSGRFGLQPLSATAFLVEDTRERVTFEALPDGRVRLRHKTHVANPLHGESATAVVRSGY